MLGTEWKVIAFFAYLASVQSAVLTPPYFNLATGRRVTASATCGVGISEPELYCKLVGANADTDININLIQGQVCDECVADENSPKSHPPTYATDGSERWWQSPPLSRGNKYNEVNLTIDLGQEFHVAYVLITMANSPRPAIWVLERSRDGGKTYKPWQYFADSPGACENYFGKETLKPITRDDSVVCDTSHSKVVPLEGGEIFVSMLKNRPSSNDFFGSEVLQEWTRATTIRLRLMRTKTLLGHLMSVARQDPTVTRRYYYSIKDISIGGRCRCNGHAENCDITDPKDQYKLLCRCQHNTCGAQCEKCCDGFTQKAWKASTYKLPFVCESCNCNGHSESCYYDEGVDTNRSSIDIHGKYEGGGVCTNCRDNTKGINCNECADGFYRPFGKYWNETDACQPCRCNDFRYTGNCAEETGRCECRKNYLSLNCEDCSPGYYDYPQCKPCDCSLNGTRDGICHTNGGMCPCKDNYKGQNCDQCAEGFYNYPECLPCECNVAGSQYQVCDPMNGNCECGNNYRERQCNACEHGYYGFPKCDFCNCDIRGTVEEICDKNQGTCLCKEGYGGRRCDTCAPGFFGYPECRPCNCSAAGSQTTECSVSGKCPCLDNFSGRQCDQCKAGFYQYPECLSCNCTVDGSMGESCDDAGQCQCKINFDGIRCDACREGYYNYPMCEDCNCDPAGTFESIWDCKDAPPGELCHCKDRVQGRICNECKPLYWNLKATNPLGCQDCDCFGPGILGGVRVCEQGRTGQCPCKNFVGQRKCTECLDGFYNLTSSNLLGCQDCGCDVGGSMNNFCDKNTGDCDCRQKVTGKTCSKPHQTYYFPTLYQFQHEVEEGRTKSGGQVRMDYNEDVFANYSWRGYAVYSEVQTETVHDVKIEKSSLYRLVLHYKNPSDSAIIGEIIATPESSQDAEQRTKVRFEPGAGFVTVSTGNVPFPFYFNPGKWIFTIKINKFLMLDYFTLLPGAYYEASVLQKRITTPCLLNITESGESPTFTPNPCVKLQYPPLSTFDTVKGEKGYVTSNGAKSVPKFYTETKVLEALDIEQTELVLLSPEQNKLTFDTNVGQSSRYALVLDYFTPEGIEETTVLVTTDSEKGTATGKAVLQNCQYSTLCRQVITTDDGEIASFPFTQATGKITIKADLKENNKIALQSISAIPIRKWNLDYIRPKEHCVIKEGACITESHDQPPDSFKVEAESENEDRIVPAESLPSGVSDKTLVKLDKQEPTLELYGTVPNPGYYKFLVQYFQPENADFAMEVVLRNGQHYEARVPAVYCPSTAGCRSLIVQDNKNSRFAIERDFSVVIKSPKNITLDYILVVPSPYENDDEVSKYLAQKPMDETRKFIAECGQNHMYIPTDTEGFCRDSVFSITIDYNMEALPCGCVKIGSKSYECKEFGGQCPCKDNIIGRRCTRCKSGYYGYPNCRKCNCPFNAVCDENTGNCECPPNVIGEKCDTCAQHTYGYHHITGCEPCNCSPTGSLHGNLQCDLITGACDCTPNVVGLNCDRCKAGFWAFPYCQLCDCDIRGTTQEVCNQDTSICSCKKNVEGRGCDNCKMESFNLQETNPDGCTRCFCFGKTTRCSSANFYWTSISIPSENWTAQAFNPNAIEEMTIGYEVASEDTGNGAFKPVFVPASDVPIPGNDSNVLYFRGSLNGNFIAAYGGKLVYTVVSDPQDPGSEPLLGPEVILEGLELAPSSRKFHVTYFEINQPGDDNSLTVEVPLLESNFVVENPDRPDIKPPTREQFMILLKGLKAIYVRGAYWKATRTTKLTDFGIQIGSETYNPEHRALSVERCQCPPNYQGLSCEECAEGYYRARTGPFGGFCVPCQCNGHSEKCDPVSGICTDCKHNTTGDHCENCEKGYHGDATVGTPYDCLICACPLPMTSNNFADSCELSFDGSEISCQCRDNYYGPRCESCAPGFYGRPEVPGEMCRPCDCSGNIDVSDPSSCDTVTGACLKCLNNTGGAACNLCARGFYGDALITKNCQTCSCNEWGTQECDSFTGDCHCLPNVEGVNCDRCKENFYGLSLKDKRGCRDCVCSEASFFKQCDDLTGQCPCKAGTDGLRCERVAPGFWNYTAEGAQSCGCNTDYAIGVGCDPMTGQCVCLPGVVGERCDRCPYRWALIENKGCYECDSCQHQLLDDTDRMAFIIDPVKKEFDEVALSYFTTQKLSYFNETVFSLSPEVNLLNPSKEDLNPYYESLEKLELDSRSQNQRAESTSESFKEKAKQGAKLREKSNEVRAAVHEAVTKATNTVTETKDLLKGLLAEEKQTSPQTEASLAEAKAIIETMKKVTFVSDDAKEENNTATAALDSVKQFITPLQLLNDEMKGQQDEMVKIREKLKDIRNESDYSRLTREKADEIASKIKAARYQTKVKVLVDRVDEMKQNIDAALSLNDNGDSLKKELEDSYENLAKAKRRVTDQQDPLKATAETLKTELENNKDTVRNSREHAAKLQQKAMMLDQDFQRSRAVSEYAFGAATAFQKISDKLNTAYEKTLEAEQNVKNATDMTRGIGDTSRKANIDSTKLLREAESVVSDVEMKLTRPLEALKISLGAVSKNVQENTDALGVITDSIDKQKKDPETSDLEQAMVNSKKGIETAKNALDSVEEILSKVPENIQKSKQLPITVTDFNKKVEVAEEQLKKANDNIPNARTVVENLDAIRPKLEEAKEDIGNKIEELKAKIASARETANRIPVGIKFVESSSLTLDNPHSIDTQQVQSKIQVYFQTAQYNGLVLFIGNEPGIKPENDYMAIQVNNGNPLLTVDLGSGPQEFPIHDKFVSDNQWYKATIERSGRRVTFTVSEDIEGTEKHYTKEGYYGLGTKSLFNVDKNATKIFVGGFPPGQFRNPVRHSNFIGSIEDLTIGEEKVGLWNFRDAVGIAPAIGRNTFVDLSPKRGLRFLGNGYAVLDKSQFPLVYKSAITLKFQTTSKNGLMFLIGKGKKFMSIEMVDGKVSLKYNLGTGVANMTTPEPYNDGRWHKLEALRDGQAGQLTIDTHIRGRGDSPGPGTGLSPSGFLYFGGYPGLHDYPEVTNKDFDGCIDEVVIEDIPVDLTKAIDTRDTMVGCPYSVDYVATFDGSGFLRLDLSSEVAKDVPVVQHPKDDIFELNFRFRSNESNGLLFYGADSTQDNFLSVSMADGYLHVRTNPGGSKIRMEPLNDGDWHVLTVTRDKDNLLVNVDDATEQSQRAPNGPLSLTSEGSVLLFGGRPADYTILPDAVESEISYKGCLGDISINGKRVGFAGSKSQGSVIAQECKMGEKLEESLGNLKGEDLQISNSDDEEELREPLPTGTPQTLTTTPAPVTTTTTVSPKKQKPTTPAPPPFEQCKLPYREFEPADEDLTLSDGIQFGNYDKSSRLEFEETKDEGLVSEYAIEFKTTQPDGVILMKTNPDSNDFIAVYMKDGLVNFAFDSGAGLGLVNSTGKLNDGNWHTVYVKRVNQAGDLVVDGEKAGTAYSSGTTTSINAGTTLFVGGLSTEVWAKHYNTRKKINSVDSPFKGCLRNLLIKKLAPGEPKLKNSIEACSDNTERGFSFFPYSGYMMLNNKFKVGRQIKLKIDIKPRTNTGLILSVHGESDYMVLQLLNGTVKFTMDNGRGALSSSFSTSPYGLCDGEWHSIAVNKIKNVVYLSVDGTFENPTVGTTGLVAVDTDHPLYFGGHPDPKGMKGLETNEQFVGCMRNLVIENRSLKYTHETIQGKVGIHSCPTD